MWAKRAREGISLLLNNDCEGAQAVFDEETDNLEMAAGKCFVIFINALLSYEPDKLEEVVDGLKELERRCVQEEGWMKSVKNRVFGWNLADPDLASKLEQQIILADSQLCVALLTFLQQDISSYIKGGWKLRRAWRVYQNTYFFMLDLYKKTFPSDSVPGSQFPTWRVVSQSASSGLLSRSDWSVHSSSSQSGNVPRSKSHSRLDPGPSNQQGMLRSSISYLSSFVFSPSVPESSIPADVVARLMSAVSFGFGIFQLCVSLVPPSVLRIVHLLGFEGDRDMALNALMFSRLGDNMRGPLALLALLWFHTIVRPFLALDGANVQAGVVIASQLYEESKDEFADSALFLFFLGRIHRLKSNIPDSLKAYEAAIEKSPQREVQLLCLHEVGWCYLIHLDWSNAYLCFDRLRHNSHWSKLFYTYLAAVTSGANGDLGKASELVRKLPKRIPEIPSERTTIQTFIARRTHRLAAPVTREACSLLCLELLYLWNALPSSNPSSALHECGDCMSEPMTGLSSFMQGVVHVYAGDMELAEKCFRQALEARKNILADPNDPDSNDDHVTAFTVVELATLLMSDSLRAEEGKNLLNDVLVNYKGYDFENKVTIRVHAVLKQ